MIVIVPITVIMIADIIIDTLTGLMIIILIIITGMIIIIVEGFNINVIPIKLHVKFRIWSCESW